MINVGTVTVVLTYSGSFTLPINLKTLTHSFLQPAPKSLVAHRVLRALWLYRRPTISFVFDTLRFILQFQVCLSSPPGSAPGLYKFALLCVSKSLTFRLSTSFNEFFPAFYTEKKQGDYYSLDYHGSKSFDIFVGSDRYTLPDMETIYYLGPFTVVTQWIPCYYFGPSLIVICHTSFTIVTCYSYILVLSLYKSWPSRP